MKRTKILKLLALFTTCSMLFGMTACQKDSDDDKNSRRHGHQEEDDDDSDETETTPQGTLSISIEAPETAPQVELTVPETTPAPDAATLLDSYYQNTLIPELGMAPERVDFTNLTRYWDDVSMSAGYNNITGVQGILFSMIEDFDHNGTTEMLVFSMKEMPLSYNYCTSAYYTQADLYCVIDGGVQQTDSYVIRPYDFTDDYAFLTGPDGQEIDTYCIVSSPIYNVQHCFLLNEVDNYTTIFIGSSATTNGFFGDGYFDYTTELTVSENNINVLVCYTQDGWGSDVDTCYKYTFVNGRDGEPQRETITNYSGYLPININDWNAMPEAFFRTGLSTSALDYSGSDPVGTITFTAGTGEFPYWR